MSSNMPLPPDLQPLSITDKESIENYFNSNSAVNEDFDFGTVHGLLTACVVGPKPVDSQHLRSAILGSMLQDPDDSRIEAIINLLPKLAYSIELTLSTGDLLELPCALSLLPEPDESQLRAWCIGFMEGLFIDEKAWFDYDQEVVAELTLPIMAVSGLFEDENDFEEFKSDIALMEHLCTQIPEILLDLFLFFHAPATSSK